MTQFYVVDAIMGVGKTTATINMINASGEDKRYIYITPYLDEVQRIKNECGQKNFNEPLPEATKFESFVRMLNNRENIVSTHALFSMLDENSIDKNLFNGYTLVMDEVADIISQAQISKDDINLIFANSDVEVDGDGRRFLLPKDYSGVFEVYKNLFYTGDISVYGENTENPSIMWLFPVGIFKSFDEVYLLTYMFEGQLQKYYYDYYNIEYENLYIENYQLTITKQEYDLSAYKELIEIYSGKLNDIGEDNFALSSSWHKKNRRFGLPTEKMLSLKRNMTSFCRRHNDGTAGDILWTTFSDSRDLIKGDGYSRGFISLNMRATNEYQDKFTVAYLANVFFNPIVAGFFKNEGIVIEEEKYALSEMLQFIFRSRIRKKQKIKVFIPSRRMRKMLEKWMEEI